jgi:hypothetical protein
MDIGQVCSSILRYKAGGLKPAAAQVPGSDYPAQVVEENPEEAVKYDSDRQSDQHDDDGTREGIHGLNIAQAVGPGLG